MTDTDNMYTETHEDTIDRGMGTGRTLRGVLAPEKGFTAVEDRLAPRSQILFLTHDTTIRYSGRSPEPSLRRLVTVR